VFTGSVQLGADRSLDQMDDYVQQVLSFDVRQGSAVRRSS
jgi:hypothetical protein